MPLFSSNNFIPNAFYLSSTRACRVAWESAIISFSFVLRCFALLRTGLDIFFFKKYIEIINFYIIFFFI